MQNMKTFFYVAHIPNIIKLIQEICYKFYEITYENSLSQYLLHSNFILLLLKNIASICKISKITNRSYISEIESL